MVTKTTTGAQAVNVPAPDFQVIEFRVRGVTPLIMHQWSDKAKQVILDKHMKKARAAKEAKNPEQDYYDSMYILPGGNPMEGPYGFPSIAFKAAMVRAGTYVEQKMTYLRGAFHVLGDMVRIEGIPQMREDMVRVQMTVDVRFRAEFPEWEADIPVRINARAISAEQVANLLVTAGFSVGIGEWRPEKDGQNGMWELM